MAELKILFLFLIIFNYKKELRCNALDIAPQGPEISPKLLSDNELTHERTKNLSGNVKLTTLELLTTNTPFDDLNNASEVIFEGTTSENKHSEIEALVENGQEDALLLSSEIGTKAPTDGYEPFALMDVFNSTSGTFPDQNSTEKLITVTSLNKLIDEDFDITKPNEANTETPNDVEHDSVDKTTSRTIRDFEENEEMQSATQNYADIEDLATFMKLDEEFLNTVTDKSEELEYLDEAIEEISSILNSYEDKSQLSPNLEDDNSEIKKQTYFETTTTEFLREETENNEEYVDNVNYETTTNLPAITTVKENLVEKSSVTINENESQVTTNVEEENKMKKERHFEISSTKEYLKGDDKSKSSISMQAENSEEYEDEMNYKTTTTIEDLNEESEVNSQTQTTISTVTSTEKSQFVINAEEEKSEMKKERKFESTTTSYEDKSMSNLNVEEENNGGYEDEMNYETTTTIKDLNEEYEENSQVTTTTNIEEENNEFVEEKYFEATTVIKDLNEENDENSQATTTTAMNIEEENNEFEEEKYFETTTVIKDLNEENDENSQATTTTKMNIEEENNEMKKEKYFETTRTDEMEFKEDENNEEYQEKMTDDITTNENLNEEYEINTLISYETTTLKQNSNQRTTVNDSEIEEKHTENNLTNFETSTRKEDIIEITENIMNSFEDKLNLEASVNEEVRVEEGETTAKDYSLLNSLEDKSLGKEEKYKEINLGTPSTEEETTTEYVISGRFAEEREDLNSTTEEEESYTDGFSDVTEAFKMNESKEHTTENYDCEEDTNIPTTKLETTTIGTIEDLNIYNKIDKEQDERRDLNNTTEEKETHFDNFSDATEENNKEDTAENEDMSSKDCEEDSTISTRKIERTTPSVILNTEDIQVGTTEKPYIYEKVDNEQEIEDKLTINIDINELEKIEEAIVREVNEIEEEDLKEMNNEGTESTTNYESKEIFTSTTILSFLKPDGYDQVITTAEMLKTESEKVEEPQISANISGRKQHFSVKIVYNESAFFVPSDALLRVQPPNFLNITWRAPNEEMNNSIELNFGNSLQLNLVKDNQMHVHKTALISEPEDKLSDTNLITLEEGIQIYFSNISFLKTDENGPGTLRRNNPMRTLAGEIVGSCIGACILIGIVVYFLAMKFRSKTRNFKPNGDA